MDPMRAFERAEDALVEQYNDGYLSAEDFQAEMRELGRDYRAAAEEAAQNAYDNERARW